MRKILCLFTLLLGISLGFTSCKNTKSDVKFNLAVIGVVDNTPTNIHFDFESNVTNVPMTFMAVRSEAVTENPTEEQVNDAYQWLQDYVKVNIIDEMPAETQYSISIKGYVHESVSGVTVAVDKVFSNIDND